MIQPQVLPNLANFTLHAESLIFTTRDQLGGGVVLPPTLVGLQSFQLFLIPEPSVMAIGVIVAGWLLLLGAGRDRRKG